jgi:hypothetical protein
MISIDLRREIDQFKKRKKRIGDGDGVGGMPGSRYLASR